MAFNIRLDKDFFNIPASVIVFKKGDVAVAIDGYTKRKIAEDTDHADVIQEAIDSLNTGIVFIKSGIYYINKTIWLRGDGKGLVGEIPSHNPAGGTPPQSFDPTTYRGGVLFVATGELDYVVRVGDAVTPTETREPLIANISVHGNAKAKVGIRFEFLTNGYVRNIWAMHCVEDGIQISGAGGYPTSSTRFEKLRSVYNGNRGLFVDINSEFCLISDVLTVCNKYAGSVLTGSGNIYVKIQSMNDNQAGDQNTYGIAFREYSPTVLYHPKVEGNRDLNLRGNGLHVSPSTEYVALTVISPHVIRVADYGIALSTTHDYTQICVYGGYLRKVGKGIVVGSANVARIVVDGLRGEEVDTPLDIGTPEYVTLRNIILNGKHSTNKGKTSITGDGTTTEFVVVEDLDDKFLTLNLASKLSARKYYVTPKIDDIDGDGKQELVAKFATAPADGETVEIYWSAQVVA